MKNKKIKIRELEDIIKNKRIYPVFQPIVDLRSGHIFAYEALSRVLGGSSMETVSYTHLTLPTTERV